LGVNPLTAEIVLVTGVSGTTFTVLRGQEGTTAIGWANLTDVTHILTAGALEALRANLRRDKPLHSSLDTINSSQDGYALTWLNSDGYWAARPGSPFTIVGNELYTTKTLSIDPSGTVASSHSDGYSKLYVNGTVLATKYIAGSEPLTTARFGYVSDATQSFVVPAGVISVKVKVWGPGGGTGSYSAQGGGGPGGYSAGYLSVTPGETLILAVGSGGKKPASSSGNGGLGGWPGGGYGTAGDASSGGGGGLTGIFNTSVTQGNALVIAGGGGGSSGYANYGAGGGGGTTGGAGLVGTSGKGGTQSAGGLNGNNTSSPAYTVGSALAGGVAFTDRTTIQANDCGGGGSGYWGGGAGQGDGDAGGGGSGFLHATRISSGITTTGANANSGNAQTAPPNSTDPDYISGIGVGAATGVTGTGNNGGDGYIILQWGGQLSFDSDSIDFANSASISTVVSDVNFTTVSPGKITLQPLGDLLLTSTTTSTLSSPNTTVSSTVTTNISGTTDVRFNTAAALRGYIDVNGTFRTGPSATTSATGFGASSFPQNAIDFYYQYNAAGSSWIEIISGSTTARGAVQVLNTGAGVSSTVGASIFAPGTSHSTVEYAGNGVIEQSGASTSALVFTKMSGAGVFGGSTGAIWQSGAWTVGRTTNNDTSSEAQAGLTGPLLNISQITGGTLTTVANQSLLYNVAGSVTLQGNTGHNFITGTTSIASTNTSRFITNQGVRGAVTTITGNLTVLDTHHHILVGTLSGSITITLPSTPTTGDIYVIKDRDGSATAFNIIIAGNGKNIEQFTGAVASSLTLNQNYDSVHLIYNDTTWSII
jgi:hypothetical protein